MRTPVDTLTQQRQSPSQPAPEEGAVNEAMVLDWLTQSVVFQGLTTEDLRRFFKNLKVVNFKPGDVVIAEGAVSSSLYIVTHGTFLARWNEAAQLGGGVPLEGHSVEFGKGDCFGEYSLIDRSPASATVTAIAPGQALQIVRHTFDAALQSDYRIAKTVYQNLLLLLTARLRAANLT